MRFGAVVWLIASVCCAQVQNAADAAAGSNAVSSIAPGSLAFVTDPISSGSPPVEGAVIAIRPVGSSTAIPAQVVDASVEGITFLVPSDAPLGNAELIFHQAGELTEYTSVRIGPSDFSLYRNPVLAVNVPTSGPAMPNGLANPAQPGEAVEIFGTGLSTIPQTAPQVTLGGVSQTILYSGNAPGEPGVLQINFQIAAATPDGCYVPIMVTWGNSTAASYLSKTSDGMPCHHPFGLPASALQTLDSGGSVETGWITMTTALNAPSQQKASRQESAGASFPELSAALIANYFTSNTPQGCSAAPLATSALLVPLPTFGNTMTLQSGATTLTLSPSESPAYSAPIPPSADGPLSNLAPPVISGGTWTWSSSGGSDLPASSFNFDLAAPVQITGGSPIPIQTGQNQTIAWNGSNFDSGASVELNLQGVGLPAVTCFAPAQSGGITIPASVLAQFTPGGVGSLSISVRETGAGIPHAVFTLSDGSPLLILVLRSSSDTRPVDFQ